MHAGDAATVPGDQPRNACAGCVPNLATPPVTRWIGTNSLRGPRTPGRYWRHDTTLHPAVTELLRATADPHTSAYQFGRDLAKNFLTDWKQEHRTGG